MLAAEALWRHTYHTTRPFYVFRLVGAFHLTPILTPFLTPTLTRTLTPTLTPTLTRTPTLALTLGASLTPRLVAAIGDTWLRAAPGRGAARQPAWSPYVHLLDWLMSHICPTVRSRSGGLARVRVRVRI